LPVRFDAKYHQSSIDAGEESSDNANRAIQFSATQEEIGEDDTQELETDAGYETLPLRPGERKKAYGLVEANGRRAPCLLDSGSQGDLMSSAFYFRHCHRLPLLPFHGHLSGFNNAQSTPRGIVNIRLNIAHRRVLVPFIVIDNALDDLLLG
jgi:hypothetical protein